MAVTAIFACSTLPAGTAFADSATPTILLSGENYDGFIAVNVQLRGNDNLSALLLELKYDREKLVMTGFEQGDALSTLDLITTPTTGENGYGAYPFRFNWSGDDNDNSNGTLLTLYFKPLSADVTGKAYVTFSYVKDRDVNYIDHGELKTRNLMIDTLSIDLTDDEIEFETDENGDDGSAKKDNTGLIIGALSGTVVVIALAVGIPLILRKRRPF